MSDNIMKFLITTNSKLSDLPITNGTLIFVKDKQLIAFDYDGKRIFFKQIMELSTETERQSLLTPINGLYYFVEDTQVLWAYQNGWINILGGNADLTNHPTTEQMNTAIQAAIGDVLGGAS